MTQLTPVSHESIVSHFVHYYISPILLLLSLHCMPYASARRFIRHFAAQAFGSALSWWLVVAPWLTGRL